MYVFTGSLTRPMPQYGAANGRGITQLAWDAGVGGAAGIGSELLEEPGVVLVE